MPTGSIVATGVRPYATCSNPSVGTEQRLALSVYCTDWLPKPLVNRVVMDAYIIGHLERCRELHHLHIDDGKPLQDLVPNSARTEVSVHLMQTEMIDSQCTLATCSPLEESSIMK